jgi:hypothetical protein
VIPADLLRRLVAEIRRLRALNYDQVLDDIGKLREAVGLPNTALPISPREAMGEAINEARRLRSYEWLQRAAADIGANLAYLEDEGAQDHEKAVADVLDILRKHRDGKA